MPHHPDDYVHRIGRTGRAGRSGTAITIVAPIDSKAVAAIEQLTGKTIDWAEAPQGAHAPRPQGASRHEPRDHERQRNRSRRSHPEREPAKVAHIDQARARRSTQRTEEADDAHLPAFLLRPVKLKA